METAEAVLAAGARQVKKGAAGGAPPRKRDDSDIPRQRMIVVPAFPRVPRCNARPAGIHIQARHLAADAIRHQFRERPGSPETG